MIVLHYLSKFVIEYFVRLEESEEVEHDFNSMDDKSENEDFITVKVPIKVHPSKMVNCESFLCKDFQNFFRLYFVVFSSSCGIGLHRVQPQSN